MAADFGVARTVVREAISQLRYDGVIESRQGVGAFVTRPERRTAFRIPKACFEKRRELLKLLKLRTGVATEAAVEAAERRKPAHLRAMRACLLEIEAFDGAVSAESRFEAELRLHGIVAEASGNEHLAAMIAMIDGQIVARFRSVAVKNVRAVESGEVAVGELGRILAAIERKDGIAAREEARRHFENAAQRLADRADFADV